MQIGILAIHKSVFGLLSIGISTILVCQKPKNRREIATKFMKTAAIKKKRINKELVTKKLNMTVYVVASSFIFVSNICLYFIYTFFDTAYLRWLFIY